MQFLGYFNTILTQNQVFSHGKQSIFHQLFFNETFVSTNYIIHPLHNQQKDSCSQTTKGLCSQPTKGFVFTNTPTLLVVCEVWTEFLQLYPAKDAIFNKVLLAADSSAMPQIIQLLGLVVTDIRMFGKTIDWCVIDIDHPNQGCIYSKVLIERVKGPVDVLKSFHNAFDFSKLLGFVKTSESFSSIYYVLRYNRTYSADILQIQ